MINLEKQITYWEEGSSQDLETAKLLIDNGRILHGLFFCHLAIEKSLKARVVEITKEIAPRSHNLLYLSEKAEITFDDDIEIFLGILMKYQLQGRYPDYKPTIPDLKRVKEYLTTTETVKLWLKVK